MAVIFCSARHVFNFESPHEKTTMTDRELIRLEKIIRAKMEEISTRQVTLKDSGVGGLMNTLKKADEALYERILPEYKQMVLRLNAK